MATRNERLNAVLLKFAPSIAAAIESGEWGPSGCPYQIEELPNGRRRIRLTDPETGDMVSGTGGDLDAALSALEVKVR